MKHRYSWDPQTDCIAIVDCNLVDLNSCLALVDELVNDPLMPAKSKLLIDAAWMQSEDRQTIGLSEMSVVEILMRKLHARFQGPIALLSTSVGNVSLSHMLAFAIEGRDLQVNAFVTKQEALEWLEEVSSQV